MDRSHRTAFPTTLVWTLTFTFCSVTMTSKAEPIVTSPAGTFQGIELIAFNGRPYQAFKGIPYAQPPVGDLRFRKPQPIGKLDGVYDATEFKSFCVQLNIMENEFEDGHENCLFLNVYAPVGAHKDQTNLKKVFVFIHGGGNMNGLSDVYGGGSMVNSQDVVMVTMNYRLGVFGFLSTASPACVGNFGLWDQIEALKWVKANIQAFGGDPNGVTIGGESAGAVDVSYLALSSESADLFQGVFAMSGVAPVDSGRVPAPNPLPFVALLARREQCLQADQPDPKTEEEIEEVIECLRQVPEGRFSNAKDLGGIPPLTAGVDGELVPKAPYYLFADPDYLKAIKFSQKKFLVGFDYNEGAIFDLIADSMMNNIPKEQRSSVPPDAIFHGIIEMFLSVYYGPVSKPVLEKVAEYYNQNHEHTPVSEFASDAVFHIPSLEYLNATSKLFAPGQSQAYLFRFVNFPEFQPERFNGTVHGMDLLYLFDGHMTDVNKIVPIGVDPTKWTEKDEALKIKFINMIGAFVNTGNPGNGVPKDDLPSTTWPAFEAESGHYFVFGDSPKLGQHFQPERSLLWRDWIPAWREEFPVGKPATAPETEDKTEKEEL